MSGGGGDRETGAGEDLQELALALRDLALRAAEGAGGGVALLFTATDEAPPRLRTAAGFPTPEAAREAAAAATAAVEEALERRAPGGAPPLRSAGPRGAAGLAVLPLAVGGRLHGALCVGAPRPLEPPQLEALLRLAQHAACRLDHARLGRELAQLRSRASASERAAEAKSDEVLKLSEALFAQDIELLRKNEKLGKIEKLKNDFIEKMSRELRTPLNSIIEAIITVLAGENDALSDSGKASLRAALDEGTAFLRTLQNILDLWRIKQGELPVEIQEVNFPEVVDEAIFSVQDTLGDKPIAIEKHFEEPFPKVRTDLAKINQILFMLLDNAAKFTERGRIDIRCRVTDGALECEVEDSGIGICPDDRQFLFEEFYQVDELCSSKYRGAGLGLALVRDLLTLLDGGVSVRSEAGKGSSFTFRVPVQVVG